MRLTDLPFLDLSDPAFSTRGPEVLAARQTHWCARTPFGLAILRHKQAGAVLRDRRFRQGSHDWPRKVGLVGSFAEFWMRSIISMEGAAHKVQRRVAMAALAPDDILALRPDFRKIASDLLCDLPGSFDFVECFSEPFAGQAIARLLGLPNSWAKALARDASTLGLAMGIDAKQHEDAVNAATDRLMTMADDLLHDRIPLRNQNTFATRLRAAAETLEMHDLQSMKDLVVISIFGGVDTTRAQLAFAMALFIEAPETWRWLRHNPDAIPNAIEDVIRHRPTTTWSTRQTLEEVELDGLAIPADTTLHVLVHATATDPATGYSGAFDPSAKRKVHFGFGGGSHHCLGQFVARTDIACALGVLLSHWKAIHWAGEPEWLPDSGNTSPRSLPIRPERS